MKNTIRGLIGLGIIGAVFGVSVAASQGAAPKLQNPIWAYAVPPEVINPPPPRSTGPQPPPAAPDPKLYSIPGTGKSFTVAQIRGADRSAMPPGVADWFPGDHPAMPKIVAEGDPARMILPCALCHYPNGKGRPENASVSGMSVDSFVDTMHDYKAGLRNGSEPLKGNTKRMADFAKAMTDEEIRETAVYFGAIPWTQWIKVVETPTVPKVKSNAGLYQPLTGAAAGKEPIGHRIIEVPVDVEQTEVLRNPRSGFIAYVPPGSVAKGKALVTTGGGKTFACAACHGADLKGLAFVPTIASRSPSYMARQLNDYKQGARKGKLSILMMPVVEKLTEDDMINITAYLATIPAPSVKTGS